MTSAQKAKRLSHLRAGKTLGRAEQVEIFNIYLDTTGRAMGSLGNCGPCWIHQMDLIATLIGYKWNRDKKKYIKK